MVEAVGHADGDLVPVVERLEPRVRIARPDCPEDVGTPASDLPGRFDDFGDAAAGRPGHPMLQFAPRPVRSGVRANRAGVPRAAGLRPRHRCDDHAAPGAVDARHHGDRPHPPAAEIPVPPTAHAAAPAITTSFPPAARAARRRLPGAHMDLEHGLRTQRAVDDPRGLDDHAFDVEETFEYAVHQAFSVVRFFGRKTEYAETPPTLTKPTAQRRTHTHENSNSATKQASASSS